MTQEGYIEVKANLFSTTPVLKWVRPVKVIKLNLLFDVYCWMIVGRESNLDFTQVDDMNPDEYLAWVVYGAYLSAQSLKNKRPRVTVEDAERWVRGILNEDRIRIYKTIANSKQVGKIVDDYQKARMGGPSEDEEEGESPKKQGGSDQRS